MKATRSRIRGWPLAVADACVDAGAAALTRCCPAVLHPGRRAAREALTVHSTRLWGDSSLARAILASRWRSRLLLRAVHGLDGAELGAFVDSRVQFRGERRLVEASASGRPMILATPHTQASVVACLAAARRFGANRPFAILYARESRNAGIPRLMASLGVPVQLLSGLAGVIRALETLRRGGCVATMPDAFHDQDDTLAIPFLGRWLRVAAGTAFLAVRSGALIVPGYARPMRGLRVSVDIGHPVDAAHCDADERQAAFAANCQLFAQFEFLIGRAPEHWVYLDRLRRLSTPMELPRCAASLDLLEALIGRCRANPGLLRRVPELARLLEQVSS